MGKARILLVEDTKAQATKIKNFLEVAGYDVIWVEDGMSAIKAAKSEQVDVILLDLVLPDIDGNEVCRWLRLNEETRDIAIIMLTAKGGTPDKVAGLTAGADDYLPKPFDDVELNARIYACLRTKSLQDELKKKNKQLEDMLTQVETLAITDPLTGLYNRRRFEAILTKEFRRADRYGHPLSCFMIDADHFKLVNDKFGHHTGDTVLKEIAALILKNVREVDTAARWGGEEFMVLIPSTTKEDSLQAAARIMKAVTGHSFSASPEIKVTLSIGVAGLPNKAIDSEDKLIQAVDTALYEAKEKGRNRVVMG
ncbi:MAG TPA: diguanylate cyclase response regulator [Nitrospiraceae bacterium]|nr:diguanylate cyclase response regulator [Nitrospiraceae bacterium]